MLPEKYPMLFPIQLLSVRKRTFFEHLISIFSIHEFQHSCITFKYLFQFQFRLGQDVDEDELEKELEELEQEELDKEMLGVGTSTHELPEVPTGDVKEPAAAAASKEKKKGISHSVNSKMSVCNQFVFFCLILNVI